MEERRAMKTSESESEEQINGGGAFMERNLRIRGKMKVDVSLYISLNQR